MPPKDQHKIIILEADLDRRDYLRSIISGWGYVPFCFENETICLDNLTPLNPDLVISGPLPLERVSRFIYTLKMINPSLPVLIVSNDHAFQDYIDTNGFVDVKLVNISFEPFEIKAAIRSILDNRLSNRSYQDYPMIIGISSEMVKIKKTVLELSRLKETVFIQGETGTGKELVAKAIHFRSDRKSKPFVKVDCAAISRELFESELFGYRSFFGTQKDKKGKFEIANKGTIFLDEIGLIPATVQARLLQLVDENSIEKLEAETEDTMDVRIIAATNTNPDLLVEKGEFRKDLYYRLNVISIKVPSLRNRIKDIPLLTDFFTGKFCGEFGKSYYKLSQKTKNIFCNYHWPGNVRELKNLVKAIVLLNTEENMLEKHFIHNKDNKFHKLINSCENIYPLVELRDLKFYMQDLKNFSLKDICGEFLARVEKKLIKKALENSSGNRKKTAMMLGISYKSLLNKIKEYKLT